MADNTIAIVGATGTQGGGLARAILEAPEPNFAVRALTRDPGSEAAQSLAEQGANVVEADLNDPDSIHRAFEGAYGAFCVTFFWEHFSPEKEKAHARLMAEAAEEASLEHVVWSTLEDTREWVPLDDDRMPTLEGEYTVPHFDGKGEADRFFEEASVPTTYLLASFYWDNMIHFGMGPQKVGADQWAITFPMGDKKLPGIAGEDIGKCAYGIFQQKREYAGKRVGIAGEHLSGEEMASALTEALDIDVQYNDISPEEYRNLEFDGAKDLGNMFQFKRDFNDYYRGIRDVEESRKLNPELNTFEEWLAKNKGRIPLEG